MLARWGALFLLSSTVNAACLELARANWRVNLKQQTAVSLGQLKKVEKFCTPLVEDPAANVLLKLSQGEQRFERRLLVPLLRHWDKLEKGKLTGGAHQEKEVFFESLAPVWATKASIEVIDLASGQVLAKGKP